MARLIGIVLGLALTVASAVLLWRPEPPPLELQAFRKLTETTPTSLAEAIRLYRQALDGDPLSPYRWCDLAEAWIEASRTGEARSCMRRAQELGPNIPQVWVRAANAYFRLDDPAEALRAAAAVLRMTPAYDAILFRYCGQFIPDPRQVLASLAGNQRAAQAYFRHALSSGSFSTAETAWAWLRQNSYADDQLAVEYLDSLVAQRQTRRALEVWSEHLGKRNADYPVLNRLFNGSFESEFTRAILDWRIQPAGQVTAARDSSLACQGRWSLRIQFAGDQNVGYGHASQAVYLPPGAYRLAAMVRTEGITTDQGIRLRVSGDRLDARTSQLIGTNGWTPLETVFSVPPSVDLVTVQVFREPSLKFDNKIAGTAWIDAVTIQPLSGGVRQR
jgi:AraC-like DNA-binding protein